MGYVLRLNAANMADVTEGQIIAGIRRTTLDNKEFQMSHQEVFSRVVSGVLGENMAMTSKLSNKTGGIDLTSDKALSIQNNGQGIKFHIDPAMLKQLQKAPGFVPVIINIQPMNDLRKFLGISEAPPAGNHLPLTY